MLARLGDAFDVLPGQWGVRGDPHVWQAMRERLAHTPTPDTAEAVRAALLDAFNSIVDVDLDTETERYVRRNEFDHGGMSGGMVDIEWWRTKGMPHLVEEACR